MEVTYICRGAKQKALTQRALFLMDFFNRVFGRFVTRGVQKHDNLFSKNPAGLITKNVAFFPSVFCSPSVVLLAFFYRVFWAFRNKEFKTRFKKNAEIFRSCQNKHLLTHLRQEKKITPPLDNI
jgi:hypothetical protein